MFVGVSGDQNQGEKQGRFHVIGVLPHDLLLITVRMQINNF